MVKAERRQPPALPDPCGLDHDSDGDGIGCEG
jgi:hypothetical protein